MARFPFQSLDFEQPIVDPATGKMTPYFQRQLFGLTDNAEETDGAAETAATAAAAALAKANAVEGRTLTAGTGLSGGGDLSADRQFDLDAALGELNNVDDTTTPPTDGQAIVWNAADSQYVPGDVASGGGGAGNGKVAFSTAPQFGGLEGSTSSSSFASKGNVFNVGRACRLVALMGYVSTGNTYDICVARTNSSMEILEIIGQEAMPTASGRFWHELATPLDLPETLTADERICVFYIRTDGTGASPARVGFSSTRRDANPYLWPDTLGQGVRWADNAPAVGETIARDSGSNQVGMALALVDPGGLEEVDRTIPLTGDNLDLGSATTTGWTLTGFSAVTSAGNVTPWDTYTHFLSGGSVSNSTAEQEIDVSAYASYIDAGDAEFYFRVKVAQNANDPEEHSVELTPRDGAGGTDLQERSIFMWRYNVTNTDRWFVLEGRMKLPVGTRVVHTNLRGIRRAGTVNNIAFTDYEPFIKIQDQISLSGGAGGGGGGGDVEVQDDGVSVLAVATALNFTGDGVTVTDDGAGAAGIAIPGGGGGSSGASFAGSQIIEGTYTGTGVDPGSFTLPVPCAFIFMFSNDTSGTSLNHVSSGFAIRGSAQGYKLGTSTAGGNPNMDGSQCALSADGLTVTVGGTGSTGLNTSGADYNYIAIPVTLPSAGGDGVWEVLDHVETVGGETSIALNVPDGNYQAYKIISHLGAQGAQTDTNIRYNNDSSGIYDYSRHWGGNSHNDSIASNDTSFNNTYFLPNSATDWPVYESTIVGLRTAGVWPSHQSTIGMWNDTLVLDAAGHWKSTADVNTIDFICEAGAASFRAGGKITLYGIRTTNPLPAGKTVVKTWDQAVDGSSATIDLTAAELGEWDELMITGRVTTSSASQNNIRLSRDDLVTIDSTSGDYQTVNPDNLDDQGASSGFFINSAGTSTDHNVLVRLIKSGGVIFAEMPMADKNVLVMRRYALAAADVDSLRVSTSAGTFDSGSLRFIKERWG